MTTRSLGGWRMTAAHQRILAILRDARLLVALGLVSAAVLSFGFLASEMLEGETIAFDRALLQVFHLSGGPLWLQEAARDVTALGSNSVLALLTTAAVVFLLLQRRRRSALLVAVTVIGGAALSTMLKSLFDRPRPELMPHSAAVFTASFPSGHAMLSAVVYLTLGALLANLVPRRRDRIYLLSLAILITALVGISRLALGVHWPSDVLAGWMLGSAWALFCWMLAARVGAGD
jgi:undecaprenyl-diphosphatase